jgi:hypothetical protein
MYKSVVVEKLLPDYISAVEEYADHSLNNRRCLVFLAFIICHPFLDNNNIHVPKKGQQ